MTLYPYTRGKFRNVGLGCTHKITTNNQIENPVITPLERQYLTELWYATGSNSQSFFTTMTSLLWAVDNNWSNRDIFFNCHNDGADWAKFKGDAAARNTSIVKLVSDELNRRGISVNFGKDNSAVFTEVSYAELAAQANAAVNSNSGVTPAFTAMSNAYNFNAMDDDIKTFMQAPDNADNIRDAVKTLNYVIPTSNDAIDILKFKQIYWGAYYLKQFPIPTGLFGVDCGQIGQTLTQLAAEKANLKQSDLDQLYSIYSKEDLQQKMQAVADLTTRFNGLYAQQNCNAVQAGSGNDVLKYSLYGLGAIFVIVIAMKILRRGHHPKPTA